MGWQPMLRVACKDIRESGTGVGGLGSCFKAASEAPRVLEFRIVMLGKSSAPGASVGTKLFAKERLYAALVVPLQSKRFWESGLHVDCIHGTRQKHTA